MITATNIKKAVLLSDTHLGVKNNSAEFLEIQKDFFYKVLIPYLNSHEDVDAIFFLGDWHDNRSSLNLVVLNESLKIMQTLTSLKPVYMILGNHDLWGKVNNDINSCEMFSLLPNFNLIRGLEYMKVAGDKNIFWMAWQHYPEEEKKILESNSAEYAFCHTSVCGIKYSTFVDVSEGNTQETFKNYENVYSGHIHYRQKRGNIRMIGCLYPLKRSDIDNQKGFYVLDFEKGSEEFIANELSPKFVQFQYNELVNMTVEEAENKINGNWVDLYVPSELYTKINVYGIIELFPKVRRLECKSINNLTSNDSFYQTNSEKSNFGILEHIIDYVDVVVKPDEVTKQKLHRLMNYLYNETLNNSKQL